MEAHSDPILDSPGSLVHEHEFISTSPLYPDSIAASVQETIDVVASMDGDARKGMSNPPKTDHTKSGTSARQRRSRSSTPRHTGPHSSQQPPGPTYQVPPANVFENESAHNQPTATYIAQPVHFQAPSPYAPGSGFVGPYTTSTQTSPMNVQRSPPAFAFQPTYHSMVLENNMITQNLHANYPPIMQSRAPVYPFQRPSSEGGQSSHRTFSSTPGPSVFPNHPSSTPTTPHLSSTSGSSSMSSPYSNPGTYHYPSTMAVPYNFPHQTYPSSPLYQPPYGSAGYGQHYSPGESEPQVTWYYFPHQSYDPGSSYQGHYGVGYPQVGHASDMQSSYNSPTQASGSGQSGHSINQPKASSSSSSSQLVEVHRLTDPSSLSDASASPHEPLADSSKAELSTSQSSGRQAQNERPLVRRSFHPNPPAHRSEWVMWVGNVPSDAAKDEVWRFFNAPADGQASGGKNGVISVFPISRSNCAFINYQSMEDLHKAIKRFNGVPLRPNDTRCPRLVCRVRRKDDDLKAGVGYQRGMGMHTRWIRERGLLEGEHRYKAHSNLPDGTLTSPSLGSISNSAKGLARAMSKVSLSSDDDGNRSLPAGHSGSSDSYSSTNSSFLARHFPQRYFILKSLSQEDLDISVARGVWATQKHNEEILDQAFRTSKDVFLIFGVNKSREFYGYARMAGPVVRGEHDVQWAARTPHAAPTSSQTSLLISDGQPPTFLSPSEGRLVDESPLSLDDEPSPSASSQVLPPYVRHSAPALLGEEYHKPTLLTPAAKQQSLDQPQAYLKRGRSEHFTLDKSALARAVRLPQDMQESYSASKALDQVEEEVDGPEMDEEVFDLSTPIIQPVEEVQRGEVTWGDTFAVEWLCTDRLPFTSTRHLRNPWNRDKEIKVSRDGTELEPSVGRRLLEDWQKGRETQSNPASTAPERASASASGKRPVIGKAGFPFPVVVGVDGVPKADVDGGARSPRA